MEKHESKYEILKTVGEGSYGVVSKCRHKETGQFVAIKKFLDSDDEKMTQKIVNREIRMLRKLRHENLINLIEVIRKRRRTQLVFEYVDQTVLDELERLPQGMPEQTVREIIFQVLRGIEFCHNHNVIHRDIKPENILVSKSGIVKLCDFGFARSVGLHGEVYTEYVATRWYRAPELLVGDAKYGKPIDVWAVGCLLVELLTGDPIFPGDSDLDQLNRIIKVFGNLNQRHREMFYKNPLFQGLKLVEVRQTSSLREQFPRLSPHALDFMKECLRLEAEERPTCSQLLRHQFFTHDGFGHRFSAELKARIQQENAQNPLLRLSGTRRTRETKDEENTKESISLKEKKKKKKEVKENLEDKPKKKHSDTNVAGRKHSPPPGSNLHTQDTTETNDISMPPIQMSGANHHISGFAGSHPHNPGTLSITGMVDSWSNSYRGSIDKSKKPIHASYLKKPNTNHQSLAINPQASYLSEKPLHEKASLVAEKPKKKLHKDENKAGRHLSFPEVKGAEGHDESDAKAPHSATTSEPGDTKAKDVKCTWEPNTIGDFSLVDDVCDPPEKPVRKPEDTAQSIVNGTYLEGVYEEMPNDGPVKLQTQEDLDYLKVDFSQYGPEVDAESKTSPQPAPKIQHGLETDSETKTSPQPAPKIPQPAPKIHFTDVKPTTPRISSSARKRRCKISQRTPTPKVNVLDLKPIQRIVRKWSSERYKYLEAKGWKQRKATNASDTNQHPAHWASSTFKPKPSRMIAKCYEETERIQAAIRNEMARRKAMWDAQEMMFLNRARRIQVQRKKMMEKNLELIYPQGHRVNMEPKLPIITKPPVVFTHKKKQTLSPLRGSSPAKKSIYLKLCCLSCAKQICKCSSAKRTFVKRPSWKDR